MLLQRRSKIRRVVVTNQGSGCLNCYELFASYFRTVSYGFAKSVDKSIYEKELR